MKTLIIFLVALISSSIFLHKLLATGAAVVHDPIANVREIEKSAWEKIKWGEQLRALQSTLRTTQQHLYTANAVKQAIGDPASVVRGIIDPYTFSSLLEWNGVPYTLSSIQQLLARGIAASDTVKSLYSEPIDIERYVNSNRYVDISAFRDSKDPLKRYRAVENAHAEFEKTISQVQRKRTVLNKQIVQLNTQLKGAKTDAEVQKMQTSLLAAQSALSSLDQIEAQSVERMKLLMALNENREKMEQVACAEINRRLDEKASKQFSKETKKLLERKK